MRKKTYKALVAVSFVSLLLCVGTYEVLRKVEDTDSLIDSEIQNIEKGITLKLLNTVNNPDGSVDKTFKYSIQPFNATNQQVKVSAKYFDNSDCSDVLKASIAIESKTITLKCKADFSKKIYVTITSLADESKSAQIVIDYVKKLKSISYRSDDQEINKIWACGYGFDSSITGKAQYKNSFTFEEIVQANYSKFTKDKSYTFKVKDVSIEEEQFYFEDPQTFEDEVKQNFEKALKTKITNMSDSYFTADEIWNFSNNNDYHSSLKVIDLDGIGTYIVNVKATYYCVEDPTKEFKIDKRWEFSFMDQNAYADKIVNVDLIKPEVTNIEF